MSVPAEVRDLRAPSLTAGAPLRDLRQWERVLRADEANMAYFAEPMALPGVTLFRAERDDAPEFDAAVIYRVPASDAPGVLRTVEQTYRGFGRRPRVRLSPCASPADWPRRLRRAGFTDCGERLSYFLVPDGVRLPETAAVRVRRARTLGDADRFSAIQAAGFELPPEHQAWDRELARRHLPSGRYAFYLAWLDGQAVGAARSIILPGGTTAMAALTTLPAARGQGAGTSLLARMIADARAAGSATIMGTVFPESPAAAMYARLGFVGLFEARTFAGPA